MKNKSGLSKATPASNTESSPRLRHSVVMVLITALITSMGSALGARVVDKGSWLFRYWTGESGLTIRVKENQRQIGGVMITLFKLPDTSTPVFSLPSDSEGFVFPKVGTGRFLLRAVVCKGQMDRGLEYSETHDVTDQSQQITLQIPTQFHLPDQPVCAYTTQNMKVSNLSVTNQKQYLQARLDENSTSYIDRGSYTFTDIPPALQGQTYVITANDDKCAEGRSGFSLRFDVNQPATVFIAHDDRYKTKPAWMSGFEKLTAGMNLAVPGGKYRYNLYRKEFPQGTITLGENIPGTCQSDGSFAMYSVIVASQSARVLATP